MKDSHGLELIIGGFFSLRREDDITKNDCCWGVCADSIDHASNNLLHHHQNKVCILCGGIQCELLKSKLKLVLISYEIFILPLLEENSLLTPGGQVQNN